MFDAVAAAQEHIANATRLLAKVKEIAEAELVDYKFFNEVVAK